MADLSAAEQAVQSLVDLAGNIAEAIPRWRPHTEVPQTEEPMTALLGGIDTEGDPLPMLYGVYIWRHGEQRFEHENDGGFMEPPFFWMPEDELVRLIPGAKETLRGG